MPNKDGHRRFGNIRKRESGRWQVRYPGPDGVLRSAPQTFATKADAQKYLALAEVQIMRNEWSDPARAKVRLSDYAQRWIGERPNLRPRTVDLYTWLLGKHITPYLGGVQLGRLDTPMIREWRAKLIENGVSVSMAAKVYRLLRAVLMTACNEDRLIPANPCRIKGADVENTPERPTLTARQVFALAEEMPDRFRAFVLLATFANLRWGEISALHRMDVDTGAGTVRVRHQYTERRGVGLVLGPPKSRAGARTVSVPAAIFPVVVEHLARYVGPEPAALVFTGPTGGPIWRGNFNKLVNWRAAVARIGAPGLHLHDLRHTGNTLAAQTGASLRDLMARMGHDSTAAALIYQHATRGADRAIADAVSARLAAAQAERANGGPNGPAAEADDGAAGVVSPGSANGPVMARDE
jgi:integrase